MGGAKFRVFCTIVGQHVTKHNIPTCFSRNSKNVMPNFMGVRLHLLKSPPSFFYSVILAIRITWIFWKKTGGGFCSMQLPRGWAGFPGFLLVLGYAWGEGGHYCGSWTTPTSWVQGPKADLMSYHIPLLNRNFCPTHNPIFIKKN